MAGGMMRPRPDESGEGPATGRQDGSEPAHEAPVRRWRGKRRLHPPQDGHSTTWEPQTLGRSGWGLSGSQRLGQYFPMKSQVTPPQHGQQSSLGAADVRLARTDKVLICGISRKNDAHCSLGIR